MGKCQGCVGCIRCSPCRSPESDQSPWGIVRLGWRISNWWDSYEFTCTCGRFTFCGVRRGHHIGPGMRKPLTTRPRQPSVSMRYRDTGYYVGHESFWGGEYDAYADSHIPLK
jgi:hypothetical protein